MQVYVDAPHISTGPLPADLPEALVNGRPTYEWWNAQRVRVHPSAPGQIDAMLALDHDASASCFSF